MTASSAHHPLAARAPPGGARSASLIFPASPSDTGPSTRSAADPGVEGNTRLTSTTAVVLFVLLFFEGITLLDRRALLTPHVVIGALLIPPVALKIGSTGYRFFRYYTGAPAYRRKGPPQWVLRVLGPAVAVLTVALLASGVALLLAPGSLGGELRSLHQATFVVWFFAMTVHVLGHLVEMVQSGGADWLGRAPVVPGTRMRQALIVVSLVAGAVVAVLLAPHVSGFVGRFPARLEG